MYPHFFLLATLIFSALSPSAHPHHGVARTSGVTIVERLRSELLDILDNETGLAEDVTLRSGRFSPSLARLRGLPGPQPTVRRGSACWWLWLLSGIDACQ